MYQVYNISTGDIARKRIHDLAQANRIASCLEDYAKYDRGHKFGVRIGA